MAASVLAGDPAWQRRQQALREQVASHRARLYSDLRGIVDGALSELPAGLAQMAVGDFLSLLAVAQEASSDGGGLAGRKRKQTLMGLDLGDVARLTLSADSGRRVTRSVAARLRQQSLGPREGPTEAHLARAQQTPRLCPGLPETPAVLRQALRENRDTAARPVRIAGSTIRAASMAPPSTARRGRARKAPPPQGPAAANLLHMELSDGKIVDVDLSQSPGALFAEMPRERTKEVTEWLSQYAATFTGFLRRLGAA